MKNGHKPRRAMPIDAHGGTYTKMPKTGKFGRSFLDATGFDCVRAKKNTPSGRVRVWVIKTRPAGVFLLCNGRTIMRYALLETHKPSLHSLVLSVHGDSVEHSGLMHI